MIYAPASAATDPLEMLSRSRGGTPLGLSCPPPPSSPHGPPDTFSLGRKDRPASRGIRVRPREALLTYRLPPISYSRNIADHNGRARAKLHLHTGRIVPFSIRVKDLARPWRCPAHGLEKRFVIVEEFTIATRHISDGDASTAISPS